MWKKFIELTLKLLDLTRTVDRHSKQIGELEKQINELQRALDRFTVIYEKDRERERAERANLVLQLENFFLKQQLQERDFAKGLPSAPTHEKGEGGSS